jgi:hypothetical protein
MAEGTTVARSWRAFLRHRRFERLTVKWMLVIHDDERF